MNINQDRNSFSNGGVPGKGFAEGVPVNPSTLTVTGIPLVPEHACRPS